MHIYFSGIGGAGTGPLALIAKQAGYSVSGSDKQDSSYINYLRKHGIDGVHIGQTRQAIAAIHDNNPIDWFVYSSAVSIENNDAPELRFCREQKIKMSKRDEFINLILRDKKLRLIAIAGTHGKTTTTAMSVWLFKQLGEPLSYLLPAKTNFADMGHYEPGSKFFVYECDEFDRNFLAFEPYFSVISGVSWDHHEIYKTREDYQAAFREFISQSQHTTMWQEDYDYLNIEAPLNIYVQADNDPLIDSLLTLRGRYNRLDAWLSIMTVQKITRSPLAGLIKSMNDFPGLSRRMEEIIPGLYSDYAHTPEKIRGAMSVALEMAQDSKKQLIVVYEPLTDRRQHYMLDDYKDCFNGASKVYWVPSYLAREDPTQRVLSPEELITHLSDPTIAEPAKRGEKLKRIIRDHLSNGHMVVAMAGGGGGSLDDWLREEFKSPGIK